jgi:transcription antitermination factor NusA-like protein
MSEKTNDEWRAKIRELLSEIPEDEYPAIKKEAINIAAGIRRKSIRVIVDNARAGKVGKP